MEDLLFLTHRIPYPPNKGDKIRSFNLLKQLVKDYRVHLGTFIDDPVDWQYVAELDKLCGQTCYEGLNPLFAKLRSTRGFLTGEALTVPYYQNARMRKWVDATLREHAIKRVLVFSSAMCQYLLQDSASHTRRVVDFVDIDSDKWQQYSESLKWPMSWLYKRESKTLLTFERRVARQFDASIFVSEAESDMFKKLAPESASRVGYIENGVDADYFSQSHNLQNPYTPEERVLVFTGAMDYWANADAVVWFAQTVFPKILQQVPDARFYIVGGRPGEGV
ncbi:FIG137776: Glycosyltransferase, partial [hydrothermal vent metagenome]